MAPVSSTMPMVTEPVEASVPVPRHHLEGFRRVHLRAGETQTVTFTLKPNQLACYDDDGIPFVEPGEFRISVGGGQPDVGHRLGPLQARVEEGDLGVEELGGGDDALAVAVGGDPLALGTGDEGSVGHPCGQVSGSHLQMGTGDLETNVPLEVVQALAERLDLGLGSGHRG